ncbi:uncharacterized protein LOC115720585 [Cannabis sativa]|uniref:uncharacterized protein LOC115720585 n=1 Tax=Cannabis sativa TaxID=3483 RepID=UPI0029CA6A73|nr:uncharacterized protein LOC115720585 [Cannabis sativa]
MAKEHETSVQPWCTLEELLLACAVNRHGTKNWDSIAMELSNRTESPWTSDTCKHRFDELKRRFTSRNDDESASFLLIVDQLKKIRLEELRREVRRRDVSIVSLELKVKRLEEEREKSLKEENEDKINLEENERRLNSPENNLAVKSNSDSCDRENRSSDESNSTSRRNGAVKSETEPEPERRNDSDPPRPESEPGKVVNGDENETMAARGEDNTKQSSDVQSSMSLSKSKRSRKRSGAEAGAGAGSGAAAVSSSGGEEPEGGDEVSPATKNRVSGLKSEPLVKFLGTVRSHRFGSVFHRRLRTQESQRYKDMIRQHIDLRTIEARLDKGVYLNGFHKFFRDLLLLFTNAVVFFRESSPEYAAAQELRSLVLKEMKAKVGKARPFIAIDHSKKVVVVEKTDSSAPKSNKSSQSIIVTCGKRSSKSSEEKVVVVDDDDDEKKKMKKKKKKSKSHDSNNNSTTSSFVSIDEKGIRKKRSQERVIGRKITNDQHEFGVNELSLHDTSKTLLLEVSNSNNSNKNKENAKKKAGVANFLKRMKQNSTDHNNNNNSNNHHHDDDHNVLEDDDDSISSGEEEEVEKINKKKMITTKKNNGKLDERVQERVTRNSTRSNKDEGSRKTRKTVGRPMKKPEKEKATVVAAAKTEVTTNKRGRDNSEGDVGVGGRLKKRSRR